MLKEIYKINKINNQIKNNFKTLKIMIINFNQKQTKINLYK